MWNILVQAAWLRISKHTSASLLYELVISLSSFLLVVIVVCVLQVASKTVHIYVVDTQQTRAKRFTSTFLIKCTSCPQPKMIWLLSREILNRHFLGQYRPMFTSGMIVAYLAIKNLSWFKKRNLLFSHQSPPPFRVHSRDPSCTWLAHGYGWQPICKRNTSLQQEVWKTNGFRFIISCSI